MAMKKMFPRRNDDDFAPPPPEKKASNESIGVGNVESEAIAEDGSLRGFFAGFLNSQGVTGDGLPIPYDALPLPLARASNEVADVKQVSEEMIFGQTLALGSEGVGGTHAVNYRDDWCNERGNLYVLVANPSGGGKSHSLNYIFKDVIRQEAIQRLQYVEERKKFEEKRTIWLKMKDSERAAAEIPVAPTKTKYIIDSATMAGLAETMQDNPRGMQWHVDEFAGFFQGIDGHAKTGAAEAKKRFMQLYDCRPWDVTRRTKDGTAQDIYVQSACLGVYGQVQTSLLGEVFTERDLYAGLTPRFLFIKANRGECPQSHDRRISRETADLLTKMTENLLALRMGHTKEEGYIPHLVDLTPEARQVFNAYYDDLMRHTFGNPVEEAFAQKAAGQTLRVALILHHMHNAIMPPNWKEITPDSMTGATKIITWCLWNLRELWHLIPGGKACRAAKPKPCGFWSSSRATRISATNGTPPPRSSARGSSGMDRTPRRRPKI